MNNNNIDMENLGLNAGLLAESQLYPGMHTGRIISQSKELYRVITASGELTAEISGKLRFEAPSPAFYPAVGDFVMLDRSDDHCGRGIIHHLLKRKSVFIRKAAGTGQTEQVVAANIDTVLICMSLNQDYNLRRAERYLGAAWDSGAVPVIVLTKADLCPDLSQALLELQQVACGVEVLAISGLTAQGCQVLKTYLGPGKTVACIGSSGVGKSTLINQLSGHGLKTQAIGHEDKGRHTTTRRELIVLPDGGVIIDTPGMRELGLEGADLAKAFADIDTLAKECRFQDCTHTKEPACAVLTAVENGQLPAERLASYLKLKREAGYAGLNARQIETAKVTAMFAEFGGKKNARDFLKEKNKHRRGW